MGENVEATLFYILVYGTTLTFLLDLSLRKQYSVEKVCVQLVTKNYIDLECFLLCLYESRKNSAPAAADHPSPRSWGGPRHIQAVTWLPRDAS